MSLKAELNWGETPWDALSKDELLMEVRRMYSTISSCASILEMNKAIGPNSPYWGDSGTGGMALNKVHEVLSSLPDDEHMYHNFFRYADDLLFKNPSIKRNWKACANGHITTPMRPESAADEKCDFCKETLKTMSWDILKPKAKS